MVGTSARVEIPVRDLGRLVAAMATLWRRWCEVPFDPDGVAVLDGERREGLRVTRGSHLTAGARYRLVFASDAKAEPHDVDLVRATGDEVEFLVDRPGLRCAVRLREPRSPGEVRLDVRGAVAELPLVGKDYAFTGAVDPAVLGSGGRAASGELRFKRLRVRASVDVAVRGTTHRVTVRVSGRPRGVLSPALVAWPFLRAKAAEGLAEALGEVARELRATDDLADRAWAELVADIAR